MVAVGKAFFFTTFMFLQSTLTVLLGYLSVLLEYIDPSHSFQPDFKKDNFSEPPQQTEGNPPFPPLMENNDIIDK